MGKIPEKIQKIIGEKAYSLDSIGMSGSQVLMFEDMVLKIQPETEEAKREYQMLDWLADKLQVPRVLCYENREGTSYLLMTRMQGEMACADYYMKNPGILLQVLAAGLKQLWSVETAGCPCDSSLDTKLRMARYNVEHGLVDMDNVQPDTFGENGFQSPEALLNWLEEHRPAEETVLSHGDFCLPNVFAKGDTLCGYIDLGRAGKADKWQDIALCYRSLKNNLEGKYGNGIHGSINGNFQAEELFTILGIEPDWQKIKYYILLDELF